MEQVARAIGVAGKRLGWNIVENRPGDLAGSLRVRKHRAVVSIVHDTSRFSITYKESENLRYRGDQSHRNDNNWIRDLERLAEFVAAHRTE